MLIKTNKVTIEIPSLLVVVGLVAASNIYANHCRKKSYKTMVDGVTKVMESQEEVEEES